jgi:hypothetical protein
MRIIQMLAEQDRRTLDGAPLAMMSSSFTDNAMTCEEEEISIGIRQMRKSVKHVTIYSKGNSSREG